jgi:ATP-dependent helicase IRC3
LLSYFNSEVGAGYKPKQAMDEDLPSVETEITEETSQGLQSEANCPIIGFTATFSRHDEMALSVVFTHIVYHRDVWDMLQDGYLCPVRMTTIKAQMDLSEVNVSSHTGDFNTRALSGKVNTKQFNELIVGTWLDQYS